LIVEIRQWARNLCELSTLLAVISDANLVETDACERMKQTLISSIKIRKPLWDNRHLESSIQVVSFFIFTHELPQTISGSGVLNFLHGSEGNYGLCSEEFVANLNSKTFDANCFILRNFAFSIKVLYELVFDQKI